MLTLAALVIVGVLSASCASSMKGARAEDKKSGDKEKKEEAVPIEVVTLATGPIESVLRYSTNLEAEREVQVLAQAPRQVVELLVEEGDEVARGQVLVKLLDDEQRSNLARVEYDLAKAQREYERQSRLHETGMTSDQAFNEATSELEKLKLMRGDAARELGYAEVRAPIAGTITARHVKLGDYVNLNQHIFDIVDFGSLVARVYVPEKELSRLAPGLEARVSAEALGPAALLGTVDRIAPLVDPKSGTVKVTVAMPRAEGLRPGMFVEVRLVTAVHDAAILIPKRSLIYDDDRPYVFRLRAEERRVDRIAVEPSLEDRVHVEPSEGFAAGDQIVVAGQAGLKDGALVRLPDDEVEDDGEDESTEGGTSV